MPLTEAGKKTKASFIKQYGKKGEGYFYAYENKHKGKGLVKKSSSKSYRAKLAKKAKGGKKANFSSQMSKVHKIMGKKY